MMLKVGIAGGIGSGKTVICQIFSTLGIPIYNADSETKQLYFTNQPLKLQLIDAFGDQFYLTPNELNKPFVRDLLNDQKNRELLNSIVHPAVFHHFETWVSLQTAPYVIKEAAILFESGANKTVDLVIGVVANPEIRIERVMKRDLMTRETVQKIMELQLSNEELISKCNDIITNNGDESLIEQVLKIHKELLHQSTHFKG
jgi:dephospho-CoA kinase